jgi:hypothetical protein
MSAISNAAAELKTPDKPKKKRAIDTRLWQKPIEPSARRKA